MYRTTGGPVNYWVLAQKYMGHKVVVWLPDEKRWKGGVLVGIIPGDDLFMVKWTRKGFGRTFKGIWRVHPVSLFTGTNLLPIPKYPARLPQSTTNDPREDHRMATKPRATKKVAPKRAAKPAAKVVEENGAKKSAGRVRGPDKLEGLSDAKKRNIAKLIYRERSKSPATSWPAIQEMVLDKYDWSLPGSMTGRRLLRDHGPDGAEAAIIKQDRTKTADSNGAKKKAVKKVAAKKKEPVVEEELEEDEEELEDEELEDEEELEEDDDEEMEEDLEDDDEEDEDEEEEPVPAPKAKKVVVKKGRGRKANPS